METIEELRELNAKLNEELASTKAILEKANATNQEKDKRIDELTTYNNKLFSRLSFEEDKPQKDNEPQTQEDVINDIIKIMSKEEK